MLSFWRSLNNFGKAVFLVLLSIVVIFLAEVRADYLVRNALDTVSIPVAQFFDGFSRKVLGVGTFIGNIGNLTEENKLLSERLKSLEAENAQIEELQIENQHLREQLGLEQKQGYDTLNARVVAREPTGIVRVITVNRGQADGVAVRMPVVVSEGLLVGYISEVYEHSARITFLLDASLEVPARLQTSRVDGMVKGQELGQGLIMELIPQGVEVTRGNRIVTSGIGDIFPAGLLIGYVQAVYQAPDELFQKADVLPAVDFERLEQVVIITAFEQ
ncbi:MAG TPA: rod shape-determining protein MreC [bacterium]|nr:rod shape-determining protein MreC [bacterium]